MDSKSSRAQKIFTTLTFVLGCMGIMTYITGWLSLYPSKDFAEIRKPTVRDFKTVRLGGGAQKEGEALWLGVSFEADLTEEFNYNTNELFVYLTATYQTDNMKHEFIIWDRLIRTKKEAKFRVNKDRAKYNIVDLQRKLKSRDLEFQLKYRYIPYFGIMQERIVGNSITFEAPMTYTDSRMDYNRY
eukprot:GHVP01015717.1.p1 GENE.GHVP01015717.1~~GHVP01015717.1.p1  ORF type:complete len:186 (+),score=25.82 GHVP01015717.1:630-1187(+)